MVNRPRRSPFYEDIVITSTKRENAFGGGGGRGDGHNMVEDRDREKDGTGEGRNSDQRTPLGKKRKTHLLLLGIIYYFIDHLSL